MARTFDGTDDEIRTSIGNCAITGAITMLIIVRRNSTAYNGLIGLHTSGGTATYSIELSDSGGALDFTGLNTSGLVVVNADSWCVIAVTKAAGTSTPRGHRYQYSNSTWSHANFGSTLADQSSVSGGTVRFGEWQDVDDFNGDIALAAIWNRSLTDAELETLPFSLNAYFALSPSGLWLFNQGATTMNVPDLTGGGANQSTLAGTTVSTTAFPFFHYDGPVLMPVRTAASGLTESPAPIVINALQPAPTTTLSNAPAAIVVNAVLPAPATTLSAPTPAAAVVNAVLPAPTVVLTQTPAAIAVNAVQVAPTTSLTNAPAAAVLNALQPAPTVITGFVQTPDPIVINAVLPAPTVTLTAAPAAIVVNALQVAPATTLTNAPAAAVLNFVLTTPTVIAGGITEVPDPVVIRAVLPAPTTSLTNAPAATVLNVIQVAPTPTLTQAPAAAVLNAATPAPTITLSQAPAPLTLSAILALPTHTLTFAAQPAILRFNLPAPATSAGTDLPVIAGVLDITSTVAGVLDVTRTVDGTLDVTSVISGTLGG